MLALHSVVAVHPCTAKDRSLSHGSPSQIHEKKNRMSDIAPAIHIFKLNFIIPRSLEAVQIQMSVTALLLLARGSSPSAFGCRRICLRLHIHISAASPARGIYDDHMHSKAAGYLLRDAGVKLRQLTSIPPSRGIAGSPHVWRPIARAPPLDSTTCQPNIPLLVHSTTAHPSVNTEKAAYKRQPDEEVVTTVMTVLAARKRRDISRRTVSSSLPSLLLSGALLQRIQVDRMRHMLVVARVQRTEWTVDRLRRGARVHRIRLRRGDSEAYTGWYAGEAMDMCGETRARRSRRASRHSWKKETPAAATSASPPISLHFVDKCRRTSNGDVDMRYENVDVRARISAGLSVRGHCEEGVQRDDGQEVGKDDTYQRPHAWRVTIPAFSAVRLPLVFCGGMMTGRAWRRRTIRRGGQKEGPKLQTSGKDAICGAQRTLNLLPSYFRGSRSTARPSLSFTVQMFNFLDAASASHTEASTRPADDHSARALRIGRPATRGRTRTDGWREDTRGTVLAGSVCATWLTALQPAEWPPELAALERVEWRMKMRRTYGGHEQGGWVGQDETWKARTGAGVDASGGTSISPRTDARHLRVEAQPDASGSTRRTTTFTERPGTNNQHKSHKIEQRMDVAGAGRLDARKTRMEGEREEGSSEQRKGLIHARQQGLIWSFALNRHSGLARPGNLYGDPGLSRDSHAVLVRALGVAGCRPAQDRHTSRSPETSD
ncbi:uncharacterized protein B0H18DRAFT_954913 [Fomitopsis serialis]|uniref:uncharacterized protein n=1 Tax=Fomitopsis serialis TaxID=139415 RepID=UPI002008EB17|nr:uncharacterized protein B0H18DRAFT_954913 [Neoantrodia serialis]KAH9926031.1 hypothetical protein B0H18DRAFT_954913 [Neoantrodia serialis]